MIFVVLAGYIRRSACFANNAAPLSASMTVAALPAIATEGVVVPANLSFALSIILATFASRSSVPTTAKAAAANKSAARRLPLRFKKLPPYRFANAFYSFIINNAAFASDKIS
jgi:hypothetical protein